MKIDPEILDGTRPFSSNGLVESNHTGRTEILEDYEPFRITKEKYIEKLPPIITIDGAKVAAAGNITVISGASKAGKTAVTGVTIAGAISKTGEIDGFPNFNVLPNLEGKAIIHFDTEQSPEDQQDFVNTVLNRNNLVSTPDYYYSYNTLQLSITEYQSFTDNICRLASERHNGLHMIIIDGGADYMKDSNDLKEAQAIVKYFRSLAVVYNCPVITIIHTNPGGDKERGHAGSEFQRRCYGLLTVEKNGDISTLKPKLMRKAGLNDIPIINFIYSKEKHYHVALDKHDTNNTNDQKELDKFRKLSNSVFAPPAAYKHKEAISKIMQTTSKKISMAKSYLDNMVGFGLVIRNDDGYYRINMDKVNLGQNGSI